ncbi:hypothetical protein N656DRAFT_114903 [Canariomyces notabilis]|uniref:Uncharacterized protein n=1 Tax=Canariomyces notabilis TaxID=2074819 RepID=A0AAN6YSU1_9PEZI|nr:hypothetical protein N656DRAFT_114903 [Canariomyces arenarius]
MPSPVKSLSFDVFECVPVQPLVHMSNFGSKLSWHGWTSSDYILYPAIMFGAGCYAKSMQSCRQMARIASHLNYPGCSASGSLSVSNCVGKYRQQHCRVILSSLPEQLVSTREPPGPMSRQ